MLCDARAPENAPRIERLRTILCLILRGPMSRRYRSEKWWWWWRWGETLKRLCIHCRCKLPQTGAAYVKRSAGADSAEFLALHSVLDEKEGRMKACETIVYIKEDAAAAAGKTLLHSRCIRRIISREMLRTRAGGRIFLASLFFFLLLFSLSFLFT